MTILITGGAGYIGSHTCVHFQQAGHDVVVIDNFCNSNRRPLQQVAKITGREVIVEEGDIRDAAFLESVFAKYSFDCVVHFAGLKTVAESAEKPLLYYDNNVVGTMRLLEAMKNSSVRKFIYSSSATVYGLPQHLPVTEDHPINPINPYGWTKAVSEQVLRDLAASDSSWNIAILRYFNPVGAHSSGLIGENPTGVPSNLMPFIAQVATGLRDELTVFGGDYDTSDGTGVRDFIHIVDLASGHLSAFCALENSDCFEVNLGTGEGYSVLELVRMFEKVSGRKVPYKIAPRRASDVASCYADTTKAQSVLNWQAEKSLQDMCHDAWNWEMQAQR